MSTAALRIGALAAALLVLPGCLVTSYSRADEHGVRISSSTLAQVAPGETSEAWVLATLGEPDARTCADDGTTMLRYDRVVEKSSSGSIFLIFGGSSRSRTVERTWFEVRDGVVTRWWRDPAAA